MDSSKHKSERQINWKSFHLEYKKGKHFFRTFSSKKVKTKADLVLNTKLTLTLKKENISIGKLIDELDKIDDDKNYHHFICKKEHDENL